MGKRIVAGNHVYEECGYCRKLVRITGWFAGVHICLLPEERRQIDLERAAARRQEAERHAAAVERIATEPKPRGRPPAR